jgi:hypothetical protein
MARAIFRVYSGRTDIDPRREHEAVKCTCGEAGLCTDHIIWHCRLFGKARDEARNKHLSPPRFTTDLKYENPTTIPEDNHDNLTTDEFDVGMFE